MAYIQCFWMLWVMVVAFVTVIESKWSVPLYQENKLKLNPKQGEILEFTQLIDHNNASLGTFQQRYYIDTTNYNPSKISPLYHIIGEEGSLEAQIPLIQSGPIYEWTKNNNALQVSLEHRYYGLSFPTKTYTANDLKYLTVDQALDDIKSFMDSIKLNYTIKGISMLFGCSYPGALAAWSKIKYPASYDVIIAGSAPVFPIIQYTPYFSWYNQAFNKYALFCYLNLQHTAEYIINDLVTTNNGRMYLKNKFNLCSTIPATNNKYIIQQFIFALMKTFAFSVQYDDAYVNFPTQQLCDKLSSTNIEINNTLNVWSQQFIESNNHECYDYNLWIGAYNITEMKQIKIPTSIHESTQKSWAYQVCTEIGLFLSMNSGQTIFGKNGIIDFNGYLDTVCTENGINIPNWNGVSNILEKEYYGYNITEYISNAFFSFGHYDPYRFSYTNWFQPNGNNVYLWEHDEAHCAMYYPESSKDSQSIKNARQFIMYWLSQF